jgi:hypothetical protein
MSLRGWVSGAAVLLAGVAALAGVRAGSLPAPAPAVRAADAAESEARLRRDVTFLASDACEGRGPTTEGIRIAADYVAAEFKKAGLRPGADGGYFQPFPLAGAKLEEPATLTLKGPRGRTLALRQGTDFQPMGIGHAGTVEGQGVVFAGFGVSNEKLGYDDYAGLDVADRVVVVLRDTPRSGYYQVLARARTLAPTDEERKRLEEMAKDASAWKRYATFNEKIANAEKHHAAALLVINDAETASAGDDLLDFNFTALGRSPAAIPVLHVRRAVVDTLFQAEGLPTLKEVEREINHDLKPHGRQLEGWTADLAVKMRRDKEAVTLKNVVGVLDGAGPHADETVVVGAHYDHLGYGGVGSLANLKKMAVHHGADDNGSGTTSLMELARRFGAVHDRQGRRLVFIAFSGEELGLFGSDYYCKHPLFPLEKTAAMFNLDMVGRLRADKDSGKDKLLIEGSGTAKTFDRLLDAVNAKYDFRLSKKASGFGPSDHASFVGKKVPVLFCWTDYHEDYHRPSDTADKINVPGMRKVVDFAQEVVAHLSGDQDRPEYVEVKRSGGPSSGMHGPRLGIRPSYSEDDEDKGVLLEGVADGEPAARAGLKAGDRIVELAGKPVKNLQSYMEVMGGQKAGGTLEVGVLRAGKKLTIKVKLD